MVVFVAELVGSLGIITEIVGPHIIELLLNGIKFGLHGLEPVLAALVVAVDHC